MDGVLPRHTKPGTAPGTLAGRAPVPDEALDFTLVEYTQEDVQVLHNVEVDECRFHLGTPGRTWIDVAGRPSSEMLRDLGMAFNLHPLALEDVFHANQRAKLDLYEGQGFIVLNDPAYEEGEIQLRQVSIFFGDNYVISFHDHKQDIFKPVRDRVQTSGSRLRMFGTDYLVYALIDLVVDRKFPLIETLASHLEELEDEALGHPTSETLGHIHQARRAAGHLPSHRMGGARDDPRRDAAGDAVHHARDAHLPARLLRPFGQPCSTCSRATAKCATA